MKPAQDIMIWSRAYAVLMWHRLITLYIEHFALELTATPCTCRAPLVIETVCQVPLIFLYDDFDLSSMREELEETAWCGATTVNRRSLTSGLPRWLPRMILPPACCRKLWGPFEIFASLMRMHTGHTKKVPISCATSALSCGEKLVCSSRVKPKGAPLTYTRLLIILYIKEGQFLRAEDRNVLYY